MSLKVRNQLEKTLCRCCHSNAQGSFKSLDTPYIWLHKEIIVLSDLLMKCFNIELAPVDVSLSHIVCTICNTCIKRLQEAVIFKRQVQKCEERFKELYAEFLDQNSRVKVEVKEELTAVEGHENEEIHVYSHDKVGKKESTKPKHEKKVKKQKKIADDEDDDGLSDPWDEIDFDMINKGDITKEKKDAAQEKSAKPVVLPSDIKKDFIKGEDYELVDDQYQCCKCKKLMTSLENFKAHFRKIHVPNHICPLCPQAFTHLSALVKHKLNEHNIDDRFKCNACDKTFYKNVLLKHHLDSFHMLGVKHKCDDCNFETFSLPKLWKHKFLHKTVKEFHCRFCNKSFLRGTTLNFHERIHTGDKRKVCNECGKAFVQKASLNYHMAKYHPEVPF